MWEEETVKRFSHGRNDPIETRDTREMNKNKMLDIFKVTYQPVIKYYGRRNS